MAKMNNNELSDWIKCDVPGDGDCLFSAVALGYLTSAKDDFILFGDRFAKLFGQDKFENVDLLARVKHTISDYNPIENSITPISCELRELITQDFRKKVVDYMRKNQQEFESFIETDFEHYLDEMNKPGKWGGHLEIEAMCKMLDCTFQIHSDTIENLGAGNDLIVLFYESPEKSYTNIRNHYKYGIHRTINTSKELDNDAQKLDPNDTNITRE
uniref:OTU domain-containing protein n=1 Tax=Acrobeloides nanus TaxID=290746 RepID=A0A914C468_9BILA